VAVSDFLVDDAGRDDAAPARRPREQLLLSEHNGALSVGLFIDPVALANLARPDPGRRVDHRNRGDFLLALEGVSHFVLTLFCARADRAVSALELELQAEVDKYVTGVLLGDGEIGTAAAWRQHLFHDVIYEPDLDADEHDRYRAA